MSKFESSSSIDLVQFQQKLLEKIADRDAIENYVSAQWLGFVVNDINYAVPLSRVKEVITAPDAYLGLGEWVSKNVKGGLQHRDDVWAVYEGVCCDKERTHLTGRPWEYRILLLKPLEVDGNLAVAVDKVVGLLPNWNLWKETKDKISKWGVEGFRVSGENENWRIWNPLVWKDTPEVTTLIMTNSGK